MGIASLIRDIRTAAGDRRNDKRRATWRSFFRRERPRVIPLTVACDLPFWAAEFGLDLSDCFLCPERYVETMLTVKLLQWETFADDTVLTPQIDLSFNTGFEPSLFGSPMALKADDYPVPGPPVIHDWADLERLQYPSFYANPAMRQVHTFYQELLKIVDGELVVNFQEWTRGPWGLAWMTRGFLSLMLDIHDHPARVHQLLAFLAECRIRWQAERDRFVLGNGNPPAKGLTAVAVGRFDQSPERRGRGAFLAQDEADGALLSRQHYHDFIFPYDAKVCASLPAVYYHSCGNLVPLLPDLARLPNLRTLHVSARTDLVAVVDQLGARFLYQKCLDPVDEVVLPGAEEVEANTKRLVEISNGVHFYISANGIGALPGALPKARQWLAVAREVTTQRSRASHPLA